MGFCLSHIFAFLTLTLVERACHAALPPSQLYWNSVLPSTPMPKALSELIQPGGVSTEPGKNFIVRIYKGDADAEELMFGYIQDAAADKVNKNKEDANAEKLMFGIQDAAAENKDNKYKGDANAEKLMFGYIQDAAADNQIDPTRVIFFLEKEIHTGTTVKYRLIGNSTRAPFLSRKTAEVIPFSSSKLPEILNQFSAKPGSVEADIVKETIQICERPATRGEEKYCAASLESMIDFTTSKLGIGRNIQAISTEVEKGGPLLQNYTITPGVKLAGNKLIACHKMSYAYTVFYCHAFEKTRAYVVPLEGADGTKAKAVAVCHLDTSEWSPKHYAFRVLKVKPGTVPICHFLKDENVAWVSN